MTERGERRVSGMVDRRQTVETLMGEIAAAVADNTRDLGKISSQLESISDQLGEREREHGDDSEALRGLSTALAAIEAQVEDMRAQAALIAKVVIQGNGQKSLVQQVSEINVRLDAVSRRAPGGTGGGHGVSTAIGLAETRGRWRTLEAIIRWVGPALVAALIEGLTHLKGLLAGH